MELLVALEYHKETPTRSSILKSISGPLLFTSGITAFGYALKLNFSDSTNSLAGILILTGMIPTTVGTWLTISGMSDHTFARWSKFTKWISLIISQLFTIVFSLLTVASSLLLIGALSVIPESDTNRMQIIIQAGVLIAVVLPGCLLSGRGPVNIGIISNRGRFGTLVRCATFETLALASPLAVGIAIMISNNSVAWIPIAVTAIAILVGYYRFRVSQIGQVFTLIVDSLEAVRSSAHLEAESITDRTSRSQSSKLLEAYRQLHFAMVSHPAYTQRSFTSHPLTVLCMVAHMRSFQRRSPEQMFKGADRIPLIRTIVRMSDQEFAIQTREVFERLIWLLDQSLTPGFYKIGSSKDLKEVFRIPELDIR